MGIQFPAVWASGLGVDPVAVYSGCFSAFTGVARMLNPVPPSPAGEGTLSSCEPARLTSASPVSVRALRAPSAPQADGQQSVQLPPPGDVLVCFAPWDAFLGLRIFAHDPGNRLMPTLTAGARSIRTLFPGCRLIPSGPCAKCVTGLECFMPHLTSTSIANVAGTVRSRGHFVMILLAVPNPTAELMS